MEENVQGTQEAVSDNQPAQVEQQVSQEPLANEHAAVQETSGATETAESESWTPEMRKIWEKKSVELKSQLQKEKDEYLKERDTLVKKAEVYDRLNSDQRAIEALTKIYHQNKEVEPEVKIPEITKEDIEAAQSDPDAQAALLRKMQERSDIQIKLLANEVNKTKAKLSQTQLVNAIADFSREAEGWDEIEGAGIIEPLLKDFRDAYPTADEIQVVEAAYRQGKKIYDTIMSKAEAKYKEQAKQIINEKKIASTDPGTASNTPLKPLPAKNWREVFNKGAEEIGLR